MALSRSDPFKPFNFLKKPSKPASRKGGIVEIGSGDEDLEAPVPRSPLSEQHPPSTSQPHSKPTRNAKQHHSQNLHPSDQPSRHRPGSRGPHTHGTSAFEDSILEKFQAETAQSQRDNRAAIRNEIGFSASRPKNLRSRTKQDIKTLQAKVADEMSSMSVPGSPVPLRKPPSTQHEYMNELEKAQSRKTRTQPPSKPHSNPFNTGGNTLRRDTRGSSSSNKTFQPSAPSSSSRLNGVSHGTERGTNFSAVQPNHFYDQAGQKGSDQGGATTSKHFPAAAQATRSRGRDMGEREVPRIGAAQTRKGQGQGVQSYTSNNYMDDLFKSTIPLAGSSSGGPSSREDAPGPGAVKGKGKENGKGRSLGPTAGRRGRKVSRSPTPSGPNDSDGDGEGYKEGRGETYKHGKTGRNHIKVNGKETTGGKGKDKEVVDLVSDSDGDSSGDRETPEKEEVPEVLEVAGPLSPSSPSSLGNPDYRGPEDPHGTPGRPGSSPKKSTQSYVEVDEDDAVSSIGDFSPTEVTAIKHKARAGSTSLDRQGRSRSSGGASSNGKRKGMERNPSPDIGLATRRERAMWAKAAEKRKGVAEKGTIHKGAEPAPKKQKLKDSMQMRDGVLAPSTAGRPCFGSSKNARPAVNPSSKFAVVLAFSISKVPVFKLERKNPWVASLETDILTFSGPGRNFSFNLHKEMKVFYFRNEASLMLGFWAQVKNDLLSQLGEDFVWQSSPEDDVLFYIELSNQNPCEKALIDELFTQANLLRKWQFELLPNQHSGDFVNLVNALGISAMPSQAPRRHAQPRKPRHSATSVGPEVASAAGPSTSKLPVRSSARIAKQDVDSPASQHQPQPQRAKYPSEPQKLVCVWPPTGRTEIEITEGDLYRLEEHEFLNDTLIEFGLKNLLINEDTGVENRMSVDDVHIFNSFFYKKVSDKSKKVAPPKTNIGPGASTARAAAAGTPGAAGIWPAYESVRKWTSKVDIFAKKMIVVPINENAHWYLAVIWNPGAILRKVGSISLPTDEVGTGSGDEEPAMDVEGGRAEDTLDRKSRRGSSPDTASVSEPGVEVPSPAENDEEEDDLGGGMYGEEVLSQGGSRERARTQSVQPERSSSPDPLEGEFCEPVPLAPPPTFYLPAKKAAAEKREKQEVRTYGTRSKPKSKDGDSVDGDALSDLLDKPKAKADTPIPRDSCIVMTLDSLTGRHVAVARVLNRWLAYEAHERKKDDNDHPLQIPFDVHEPAWYKAVDVPIQDNFSDCGVYLLHYVRRLLPRDGMMTLLESYWVGLSPETKKVKPFHEEWRVEEAKEGRKFWKGVIDKLRKRESLERSAVPETQEAKAEGSGVIPSTQESVQVVPAPVPPASEEQAQAEEEVPAAGEQGERPSALAPAFDIFMDTRDASQDGPQTGSTEDRVSAENQLPSAGQTDSSTDDVHMDGQSADGAKSEEDDPMLKMDGRQDPPIPGVPPQSGLSSLTPGDPRHGTSDLPSNNTRTTSQSPGTLSRVAGVLGALAAVASAPLGIVRPSTGGGSAFAQTSADLTSDQGGPMDIDPSPGSTSGPQGQGDGSIQAPLDLDVDDLDVDMEGNRSQTGEADNSMLVDDNPMPAPAPVFDIHGTPSTQLEDLQPKSISAKSPNGSTHTWWDSGQPRADSASNLAVASNSSNHPVRSPRSGQKAPVLSTSRHGKTLPEWFGKKPQNPSALHQSEEVRVQPPSPSGGSAQPSPRRSRSTFKSPGSSRPTDDPMTSPGPRSSTSNRAQASPRSSYRSAVENEVVDISE